MTDFYKLVLFGSIDDGQRRMDVFAEIKFSDGRLSISGVEGPKANGDCWGSAGQLVMGMLGSPPDPAKGWTAEMVTEFLTVWDRWHLNDMRAGSPAQEAELHRHPRPAPGVDHYKWARDTLAAARLNPDEGHLVDGKPYEYGRAWLTEDVPAEVLEYLRGLPDSPKSLPGWWARTA